VIGGHTTTWPRRAMSGSLEFLSHDIHNGAERQRLGDGNGVELARALAPRPRPTIPPLVLFAFSGEERRADSVALVRRNTPLDPLGARNRMS